MNWNKSLTILPQPLCQSRRTTQTAKQVCYFVASATPTNNAVLPCSERKNLCPCTCRCHQEQLAAEEQARKEQQRLDRIRRLKANGLQDRALFAYTFDKADNGKPAIKYAHRYVDIGQR